MSDYESARRVNELGINILVNMNGYTASGRTEIFAYTPAPVQILMQVGNMPGSLSSMRMSLLLASICSC